ncbi:sodium transport system permease protein [Inhella inkyongensis]|uniref:Sodium transport system permease protein n=1 Tax=Inhella inkyongensis TaxID=392593 RepID=A0A840S5W1_9BURK|nr:ABC transporter permease [Inhella inkyongensis]MBB5204962.1 sodium transport system permease protein [Inhella inkyongensis]
MTQFANTPRVMSPLGQIVVVFVKELIDALRDRRTLGRLAVPALLMGPVMLMLFSGLISQFESKAEQREVVVLGMPHAPTLRNFIERQNYSIKEAPADYEAQLRSSQLSDPVLVIPETFEAELARGDKPALEVVTDSANNRASAGARVVVALVESFGRERAALGLMLRGVATDSLRPVDLTERDLASPGARASRLTGMLPMFVIMAVLYGCLTAALDSTSGERERGSLEPLLMNPVKHFGLVMGKWAAVALVGAGVAVLCALSFMPAQLLLKSDSLQAMFRFGWGEVAGFTLVLLPLCAALGALLMAVAIRTKTFKEAQASATMVMTVVSLTPMVSIMNPGGDAPWYFWVPGLGQNQLMMLILKGEPMQLMQWGPALVTAAALTAACLIYVARHMREAVSR